MLKRFLLRFKKATVATEHSSGEIEQSIKAVIKETGYRGNFETVLEIGSRDGFDAERISKVLGVKPEKVFIAEANPECFRFIKKTYPLFQAVNKAVYNKETILDFNYVFKENIGTSSLLDRIDDYYADKSKKIRIESVTGENLLRQFKLERVSFCKIDVEGATYEVLESFGDSIQQIDFLHLECEHVEIWKDEKLFPEIEAYLIQKDFKCCRFEYIGNVERQSDSIWMNKKSQAFNGAL